MYIVKITKGFLARPDTSLDLVFTTWEDVYKQCFGISLKTANLTGNLGGSTQITCIPHGNPSKLGLQADLEWTAIT